MIWRFCALRLKEYVMSENIRLALKGIWSHRLRSFLT